MLKFKFAQNLALLLVMAVAPICHGWFFATELHQEKNLITDESTYLIGTGIGDVTGPAASVNMMGYADPSQTTSGIHLRLFSRAFIIADAKNTSRVVFVSADMCMGSELVKLEVINRLKQSYGNLYTPQNLVISAIHTHSGPAGYNQYVLLDVTSLGFVRESFEATVEGIVASIKQAHENMVSGNIMVTEGNLLETNINRSPTAYENNPAEERKKYEHDVDKNMVLLKLKSENGKDLGMINWFAVHCTSMNNTNSLISGDNKGYASYLMEQLFNRKRPGKGSFVAAFAQTNEGDVSPNTRGAHCQDTGQACARNTSTCNGRSQMCVANGPGKDMFESTEIIGRQQFEKARELYNDNSTKILSGPINFIHQYVNMTNVTLTINGTKVKTCKPAMGYSFAAGTTDGPGAFDFTQGMTEGNPFWNTIRNAIKEPSIEEVECHKPKPILLPTGEMSFPYAWQPEVVDLQILQIGSLAIVAVPGEFTTMSGRRMRDTIREVLMNHGWPSNTTVVIAGLSNIYTSYITTYEEYQIQRYEGASTIFGPNTLNAYIQEYGRLANALAKGEKVNPGPDPDFLLENQLEFLPTPREDNAPLLSEFGDVLEDVKLEYKKGEVVKVVFVSSNPRNHPQINNTFLVIEYERTPSGWVTIYDDADWSTRFNWKRGNFLLNTSEATITWEIPLETTPGTYRIKHFGHRKKITLEGHVYEPFTGTSSNFRVVLDNEIFDTRVKCDKSI